MLVLLPTARQETRHCLGGIVVSNVLICKVYFTLKGQPRKIFDFRFLDKTVPLSLMTYVHVGC